MNTLFDDVDGKIMLWTLPDKKSYFFDGPDEAGKAAVSNYNGHDVYVGVGIARGAVSSGKRGKSDNILSMPALVADLDVDAEGVDSKKPRFKDEEGARAFLSTLPLQPTIVVWSGGGLHAYWCFNEPYEINTKQDSVEILKLSKGWSGFVQKEALKLGVVVDSVWDVTRVLRVPGTNNHKTAMARPVRLLECEANIRYNPDDFDDYLSYDRADYGLVVESKQFGSLVLSPEAKPPAEKLEAFLANSPEFEEAFRRTRRTGDQSASAYDMSLANHAAIAGWEPQEICNLLIFSRVRHGDDLKLRESYYATTIARAMTPRETDSMINDVQVLVETAADCKKDKWDRATLPEGLRTGAIETLQDLLRVPVVEFIQHGMTQHATFTARFIDGNTDSFDSVANFYSQKTWINIADIHGADSRPPLKDKEWLKIKALIKAIIIHANVTEYDERTETIRWIKAFAGGKLYTLEESGDVALPFRCDGHVYLKVAPMLDFLQRTKRVAFKFTPQSLGGRLNSLGFKMVFKTPTGASRGRFRECDLAELPELL